MTGACRRNAGQCATTGRRMKHPLPRTDAAPAAQVRRSDGRDRAVTIPWAQARANRARAGLLARGSKRDARPSRIPAYPVAAPLPGAGRIRSPLTVAGTAAVLGLSPRTAFPFKPLAGHQRDRGGMSPCRRVLRIVGRYRLVHGRLPGGLGPDPGQVRVRTRLPPRGFLRCRAAPPLDGQSNEKRPAEPEYIGASSYFASLLDNITQN